MEISSNALQFFINENKRREAGLIDSTLLHLKIKKYFCEPLNKEGRCPQNCPKCSSVLLKVVSSINRKKERDVYGALSRYLIFARDNILSNGNKTNLP